MLALPQLILWWSAILTTPPEHIHVHVLVFTRWYRHSSPTECGKLVWSRGDRALPEVFHSHAIICRPDGRAMHGALSYQWDFHLQWMISVAICHKAEKAVFLVSASSNSNFVLVTHVFLSFWTCLQSQQENVSLIFYLCLREGVLNHFCIGKSRSPKTQMLSQDAWS